MIQTIFTVFDSKAAAYLQPFFLPNSAMATRAFKDLVNQQGHNFAAHPEDYTLFELGKFDDSTAKVVMHDAPISLGVGVEHLNSRSPSLELLQEHLLNRQAN